jgi:hypothetical protein
MNFIGIRGGKRESHASLYWRIGVLRTTCEPHYQSFCFYYLFIYVGLEFELRAMCLQSRCSIAWVTPPLLLLFFRWGLILLPWPTLDSDPPTSASEVAGITSGSCCTISHSHQQHLRLAVSPYPNWCLSLSFWSCVLSLHGALPFKNISIHMLSPKPAFSSAGTLLLLQAPFPSLP